MKANAWYDASNLSLKGNMAELTSLGNDKTGYEFRDLTRVGSNAIDIKLTGNSTYYAGQYELRISSSNSSWSAPKTVTLNNTSTATNRKVNTATVWNSISSNPEYESFVTNIVKIFGF